MKKFISLALTASMALSLVPVTAFAATSNRVDKVVTVEKDTVLDDSAPTIVIKNNNNDISGNVEFGLELEGAEFSDNLTITTPGTDTDTPGSDGIVDGIVISGAGTTGSITSGQYEVKYVSSTYAIVTITGATIGEDDEIKITLGDTNNGCGVKVTGDVAKVTIDPRQSAVSADTFTFAKGTDGATIATIEKTTDFQDGGAVKDIIIEEVTPGMFDKTGNKIKLKLNSGFKFAAVPTIEVVSGGGTLDFTDEDGSTDGIQGTISGRDAEFEVSAVSNATTAIIKISNIKIAEDGADFGDVAEITVSGNGVTKQTLEVGTYSDFGVSASVEDKDLPVIYSGIDVDDDNNETLELTVKENIEASWLTSNRKTTFTFPEGVKVKAINVEDTSNINVTEGDDVTATYSGSDTNQFSIDGNEVTLLAGRTITSGKKAELKLTFDVVVSPDFTGDITCTVGGPAVGESIETKLAKAVAPITVEADKTSVAIDYRNVNVGDITIKEAEAGIWQKGKTITLKVDNMQFESGIKAEVVEGDGEIKDLSINKDNGTIEITVKSESSKTPMNIKLSNVSLYLNRSLPAGDYSLSLVADKAYTMPATAPGSVMFQTYNNQDGNEPVGSNKLDFGFDVDTVEVLKDYVTVATAGRDQGTSFTTEVKVTIDSTKMIVDGVEKDLSQGTATSTAPVPAPYLTADGYTMVPVRAVTEALASSANKEPVSWVNGTVLISYGDRTVSMTIGSTTMYINGTPVPMNTAPVIVDGYTFIPYRDLGNALGLTSEQIAWDAATRTATFNPATTATK